MTGYRAALRLMAWLALCTVSLAASTDPLIGIWKLNLKQSTLPVEQAPISWTTKFESIDSNKTRVIQEIVHLDGKVAQMEWIVKFNGMDYPEINKANPDTTSAFRRLSPNILEKIDKTGGKETLKWRIILSKDGKTLTATAGSSNEQDAEAVLVFDRE